MGTWMGTDVERLTEREREVLTLIATGMCNREIARELFLSPATVKTHVARVLRKLGLRDRTQAVVAAYDLGIVRPRLSGQEKDVEPSSMLLLAWT